MILLRLSVESCIVEKCVDSSTEGSKSDIKVEAEQVNCTKNILHSFNISKSLFSMSLFSM